MTQPTAQPGAEKSAEQYTAELEAIGESAGLVAVGATRARPWTQTRTRIEQRRAEGLNASMAFTGRNPARSTEPNRLLKNCRWLLVGAHPYAQDVDAPPEGRPMARVARYATADVYGRLDAALGEVAERLRSDGHRAVVVSDDNGLVDREAAWRAGLGWFGKNANLLMSGGGSWVVLGAVATDATLAQIHPPVADGCGTCRRCIDRCPTGAIVAPGVVDARRCIPWLLQAPGSIPADLRAAIGTRIYGCDDCQEVCPPNRLEHRRLSSRGELRVESDPGTWVDPVELLELDDATLLERCGRWYIPGRNPASLRRNLLVVLANAASSEIGRDLRARRAIVAHLTHSDPIVAEHARWALGRLDGPDAADSGETPPP